MDRPIEISGRYDSPFRGTLRLFVLGILSLIAYIALALLAEEGLNPSSPDKQSVLRFIQLYGFLFVCYWLLIAPLAKGRRMDPRHLWFAISFALFYRAILLPTDLILENDVYRYMWDGHTSRQGINPFRYAPLDEETKPYRTDYWFQINDPHIPTAYPPTLQFVFFLSESLYPGSVIGMKFILLAFDIGTIFLLISILQQLKRPPEWCLIYAWSPLVIKEFTNSGYADAAIVFLLALVIFVLSKRKPLFSAISLAALTLTKFFGFLYLPLYHRSWNFRFYVLFGVTLLVLYIPFLSFDVNLFEGVARFSREWRFNGGFYSFVVFGLNQIGGKASENADPLARLFVSAVVMIVVMYYSIALNFRSKIEDLIWAMFVVTAILIVCLPVIKPWYLTWLLPFLCIFPQRSWILLSGLVILSYTYYIDRSIPLWATWGEFGFFVYILGIDLISPINRWGKIMDTSLHEEDSRAESQ